jgi:hypothetical protein
MNLAKLSDDSHWRVWTATLISILIAIAFAVSEAILILTLGVSYKCHFHKDLRSNMADRVLTREVLCGP